MILRLRAEKPGTRPSPCWPPRPDGVRWALSHIAVAVAGAALLAAARAATGLGYGLRAGSAGTKVARMTVAAMAQLPSALVLASVAVFFGLLPRAAAAGPWTAVGLAVAIALFGGGGAAQGPPRRVRQQAGGVRRAGRAVASGGSGGAGVDDGGVAGLLAGVAGVAACLDCR